MIHWPEKYGWEVLNNQENEEMHLIELIPKGEKADDWSILGQMMSLKNVTDVPMQDAMDLMIQQSLQLSTEAKHTVIEKDETEEFPWILFKIEDAYPADENGERKGEIESQIWFIRQGDTSLFITF